MDTVDITNLDWNLLWQQAHKKKSWQSKNAEEWDRKASSFARRISTSTYTDRFLELLKPQPHWSILDVGCGPGTLTIPLAAMVRRLTAFDFSRNMLDILRQEAAAKGLNNITIQHLSWEEDWQSVRIPIHDVAIASRSLTVKDLRTALTKLSASAREKVVITDRVKYGPFDPRAFAAVGRPLDAGPDYIYTVNLLYQMGYLPTVDYIRLEETLHYSSFEEAMAGYRWMFRDLNENEEQRLERYVRSIADSEDGQTVSVHRRHVPTWAYITWKPLLE